MQRIFSTLKQTFRKSILILGLISLISLSSPFIFATQPSYAATPTQKVTPNQDLSRQEKTIKQKEIVNSRDQGAANSREQAYEEQVQAAADPDKVYEENLKEYKKENPGEGLVQKTVEGAEKLVNKVTGNE